MRALRLVEFIALCLIILGLGALLYMGEGYSIKKSCEFHKANNWPEPAWEQRCKDILSDP